MSDEEKADIYLVEQLTKACLRAGQSNSGMCISFGAEYDMNCARELRDKLLTRLRELRTRTINATTVHTST